MNSKNQVKYVNELLKKVLIKYGEINLFIQQKKVKDLEINKEYLKNCSYEDMNKLIRKCWDLIDGRIEHVGYISEAFNL